MGQVLCPLRVLDPAMSASRGVLASFDFGRNYQLVAKIAIR